MGELVLLGHMKWS